MVKVVSKKSGCECRQAARPKQSYKIQIKNNFKLYKANEIISTRIEILLVIIIDNNRIAGGDRGLEEDTGNWGQVQGAGVGLVG